MKASKQLTKEHLVVLGWKNERWNVLDKVPVRNLQKDLVSFGTSENYERCLLSIMRKYIHTLLSGSSLCWLKCLLFSRLIVLRLLSSIQPSCLVHFAAELQESVRACTVSITLLRGQEDPSSVALVLLPSRNLNWGLAELHAQGYCGSPEQSAETILREGEQLLLKFSGNITSKGI